MGKVRLAPGAFGNFAAFVLTGGGAVTGATAEQLWVQAIGWAGMAIGFAYLVWGVTIDGEHWWKQLRRTTPPQRVTFGELVRRVALESEWGLNYELQGHYGWSRDLQRQIIDEFSAGRIEAEGLYTESGRPDARGATPIPVSFWQSARFDPEFALGGCKHISVYAGGRPPTARVDEITVAASDMDRIWPKVPKRKRRGRKPAIRGAILEWMQEQKDIDPRIASRWSEYVENQYRYDRNMLNRMEQPDD